MPLSFYAVAGLVAMHRREGTFEIQSQNCQLVNAACCSLTGCSLCSSWLHLIPTYFDGLVCLEFASVAHPTNTSLGSLHSMHTKTHRLSVHQVQTAKTHRLDSQAEHWAHRQTVTQADADRGVTLTVWEGVRHPPGGGHPAHPCPRHHQRHALHTPSPLLPCPP